MVIGWDKFVAPAWVHQVLPTSMFLTVRPKSGGVEGGGRCDWKEFEFKCPLIFDTPCWMSLHAC